MIFMNEVEIIHESDTCERAHNPIGMVINIINPFIKSTSATTRST